MKKSIFAAIAAFGMLFGAQFNASAQVEEGTFIIDPYVGFPTSNVWWENIIDFTGAVNVTTLGGPVGFGGRFSYMVSDNFGLGLDVNYVKTGFEYTCLECGSEWDTLTSTYNDQIWSYEALKLRFMIRMDYHFVQTENLDVYVGVGAGYKYVKRKESIDGIEEASGVVLTTPSIGAFIPVATRVAIGMRYYFIQNLGLSLELGLGGGQLIEGGLAIKI